MPLARQWPVGSPPVPKAGQGSASNAVRNRPRWWGELLLIALVLWAYDAINNLNPLRITTALAHGESIIRFEQRIHLAPEVWLNSALHGHLAIGRAVGDYYDIAHFVVTFAILGWLWWSHPGPYRVARNALLAINAIGFAVFWLFPVAPPRMLPGFGFIDIVAVAHSIGAWSSGTLAKQANEYAAMPSLHVAWALWCTVMVSWVRRDRLSRVAAWVYVLLTCVAVMATANHYFLDVVAGAATAGLAFAIARAIANRRRVAPAIEDPVVIAPALQLAPASVASEAES